MQPMTPMHVPNSVGNAGKRFVMNVIQKWNTLETLLAKTVGIGIKNYQSIRGLYLLHQPAQKP